MTTELCAKCGYAPRMMKRNGTGYLTMCEECQHEYWNEKKRERSGYQKRGTRSRDVAIQQRKEQGVTPPLTDKRTCKDCGQTLPLEDFPKNGKYRKTICKTCYTRKVNGAKSGVEKTASPAPAPKTQGEPLVLIDRIRNRVLLCQVIGTEELTEDIHVGRLARQFVRTGHRVMLAGEITEVARGR